LTVAPSPFDILDDFFERLQALWEPDAAPAPPTPQTVAVTTPIITLDTKKKRVSKNKNSIEKVKKISTLKGILGRVKQLRRSHWENGDPVEDSYASAVVSRLLSIHTHNLKKTTLRRVTTKRQKQWTKADKIQTLYMFHKMDLSKRQERGFRRFTKQFQAFASAGEISKLVDEINVEYKTKFVPTPLVGRVGYGVSLSGAIEMTIKIVKCFLDEPQSNFPQTEYANMNSKLSKLKATFSELKSKLGPCSIEESQKTEQLFPTIYKETSSEFTCLTESGFLIII
jgi:hypothetical protein